MSRYHSKYHRKNHHTYTNPNNPDAGHDPIASPKQPFLGDFCLFGALSTSAPLSAFAGYFYSNNTALCAIGGLRGAHIISPNIGIELLSRNISLSAFGQNLGAYLASPKEALNIVAGDVGAEIASNNISLSAFGKNLGAYLASPKEALNIVAGDVGAEIASNNISLSAFGKNLGAYLASPKEALNIVAGDVGAEIASNNISLSAFGQNVAAQLYSLNIPLSTSFGRNILNGRVGVNQNNPASALDVFGDSILDGNVRVTGNQIINGSLNVGGNSNFASNVTIMGNLSTLGDITYLDTRVTVTSSFQITNIGTGPALTVTQTGDQAIARFVDDSGVSLIIDGKISTPGFVGVKTETPNVEFTVNGRISSSDSSFVGQDLTVFRNITGGVGVFSPTVSTREIKNDTILLSTNNNNTLAIFTNGNTTLSSNVVFTGTLSAPRQRFDFDDALITKGFLDGERLNGYFKTYNGNLYANTVNLSGAGSVVREYVNTIITVGPTTYSRVGSLLNYDLYYFTPPAKSIGFQFSKKMIFSVIFSFSTGITSDGIIRFCLGGNRDNWNVTNPAYNRNVTGNDLFNPSIGFKIQNNQLFLQAYKTGLVTSSALATVGVGILPEVLNVLKFVLENGICQLYLNDVYLGQISGCPDADTSLSDCLMYTELMNRSGGSFNVRFMQFNMWMAR